MEERLSLPFLTRKMLAFEYGMALTLRVESLGSAGGELWIQGATREGPFTFRHKTSNNYDAVVTDFRIPDMPIFLSVVDGLETMQQGDCYVRATILANGVEIRQLVTGKVYTKHSISWPEYQAPDMHPAGGRLRILSSADPAAGAEFVIYNSNYTICRLISLRFQLVTSAAVANRRVHVLLNDNLAAVIDCFSGVEQAASLTRNYSCAAFGAIPDEVDGNDIIIAIPNNIIILEGGRITSETVGKDAGDNFGIVSALVEQFWCQQN